MQGQQSQLAVSNATSSTAPDIITYRLQDKMIYVAPAADYEQAIDFAQAIFSAELGNIDRRRISFSVTVFAGKQMRSVGISSLAWPAIVSHLARYEVVDVHVQPELVVGSSDSPPKYVETVHDASKEASPRYRRDRRSHSPQSQTHLTSRQPSPPSESGGSSNSSRRSRLNFLRRPSV